MTKISYIHSVVPYDEWSDRGAEIPAQNYINYSAMTSGEMKLALLQEQLSMLAAFYPEKKEFQQGKSMLENALYRGIHGAPPAFGILTPGLQAVAGAINKARRNNRPANGLAIVQRQDTRMGGIGNPLVPMQDCEPLMQEYYATNNMATLEKYKLCREANKYVPTLNQHLEKGSYHLLYEFTTPQQGAEYNFVATKRVLHKAGTTTMHNITKVEQENLRLWMRNGVMRSNTKKGIAPLQPEQSIAALKENAGAGVGIDPVTLIAIIGAITAAIIELSKLVANIKATSKNQYAFQEVQGIGTGPFGPAAEDWFLLGGENEENEKDSEKSEANSNIPLLFGAAAAAFLFLN